MGQEEAGMKSGDAAKGRWREILTVLGIPESVLDGRHHPCPCSGEGTDRFRFSDQGRGAFFCHCSDGEGGGFDLLRCHTGLSFADVAKRVDEITGRKADAVERVSYYCDMLRARARKTTRSAYLEARGLTVAPGLDWCTEVKYYDEDGKVSGEHPAMLAPIERGGVFLSYHVTYLGKGGKAAVPRPRKILPGRELRGGACALYPAAETMGIAEGVETAIAAHILHGIPVWAALNTSLMKSFDPPPECRHLLIFGDHDAHYAGHAAAYHLAHRLSGKLESVTVFFPTMVGDWNDVLLKSREAA